MQHLRVAIDIIESARFPAMYADLLGFQLRIGSMFDILHRRPASMDALLEGLQYLVDFLDRCRGGSGSWRNDSESGGSRSSAD